MRKVGNRVRITVQLIDARKDRHIWAERYDRELEDIFAIQDEVTSSIVATLPGRVEAATYQSIARKPTESMAAYELVLTAKILHHRFRKEDNLQAQKVIESALALDPNYAHAHAWRACIIGQSIVNNWAPDRDLAWRTVNDELKTALALDRDDSDVHRILSAVNLMSRNYEAVRVSSAARGRAQSQQRFDRCRAGRTVHLARRAGKRHRVDQEGDASQPASSRSLLESPRAGILRRPPLPRGDRRIQTYQPSQSISSRLSRCLVCHDERAQPPRPRTRKAPSRSIRISRSMPICGRFTIGAMPIATITAKPC